MVIFCVSHKMVPLHSLERASVSRDPLVDASPVKCPYKDKRNLVFIIYSINILFSSPIKSMIEMHISCNLTYSISLTSTASGLCFAYWSFRIALTSPEGEACHLNVGVSEAWLTSFTLWAVPPFQKGLTLGGTGISSPKSIWSLFL